jgi:DNA-binding SARP family transcriptional activator
LSDPPEQPQVRVDLLGPLDIHVAGEAVSAGGPKLRALVALMALATPRVVSVDNLLDGIWGENLPNTARNTLQYHVGVLRKALSAVDAAESLISRDPGYGLVTVTDVSEFLERSAAGGRAADAGRFEEASVEYADALNAWRGHALADLRDFEFAESRAVALEAQRLGCLEAWADAELACGRADTLIPTLQELVGANPTRERLWEQLMVALYRTGRQDAALSAFRTARAALDRELGVDPSARLVAVHQAVLNHDPALAPVPALRPAPARALTSTTLVAAEPRSVPPTLIGPGGVRIEVGEPVLLGRQSSCDLVVEDDQASRTHARVERDDDGGCRLVDLDSTNGTYLNGTRVDGAVALDDGDRIEIGHVLVLFVQGCAGPSPRT